MISLIVVLTVIFVFFFSQKKLSVYFTSKAKTEMQCIAFLSDKAFHQMRLVFTEEKIVQTTMPWSASSAAYAQPGAAEFSPKEVWTLKQEAERAKALIEANQFKTEVTKFAVLVK